MLTTRVQLKKVAARAVFHAYCLTALRRLGTRRDPAATSLRRAIGTAFRVGLNKDERARLSTIEAQRFRMLAETRAIDVVDHGAGPSSGTSRPSSDIMAHRAIGEICLSASKTPAESRLLFRLVREISPEIALELGTCLGITAAYQASALALNGHGRLHTIDGSSALADVARSNLDSLGLTAATVHVGRFQEALQPLLEFEQSVGFVFLDGHHEETATQAYWRCVKPHLAPRAVVVFDDIRWSGGMRRTWRTIRGDESVHTAADLGTLGVCFVGRW